MNETIRQQIYISSLATIRNRRDDLNLSEITRDISNRYGIHLPGERGQVSTIVRSANKAYESGQILNDSPGERLRVAAHGTDPTLNRAEGRFGYRVILRYGLPGDNDGVEAMTIVRSDSPLTSDQVKAQALATVARLSNDQDYRNQIDRQPAGLQWEAFIRSAGQAP